MSTLTHGDATLRTGWTMRRGEIRTKTGTWKVEATDRSRRAVVAMGEHGPAVRLDPGRTHVPGPGGPAIWRPGRNGGVLTRGTARIEVQLSRGGRARIQITGTWSEPDLVALTACFAVMTRRRQRTLRIMAIAGAMGHGSVG